LSNLALYLTGVPIAEQNPLPNNFRRCSLPPNTKVRRPRCSGPGARLAGVDHAADEVLGDGAGVGRVVEAQVRRIGHGAEQALGAGAHAAHVLVGLARTLMRRTLAALDVHLAQLVVTLRSGHLGTMAQQAVDLLGHGREPSHWKFRNILTIDI